MPRRKYNYIHLYNGKEVDKATFYRHLLMLCVEVIVYDEDNPLMNVEVADEKKADKFYKKMKRNGQIYIIVSDGYGESFQIRKERIKK